MIDFPEENDYTNDKRSADRVADDEPDEYVSGADYQRSLQELTPRVRVKVGWQQKFAVVFLSLFGVSAVVLWAVQFNSGLQVSKPLTAEQLADSQSSDQAASDALLRNQDTDGDGLSDYLELALYNTSPYLEDTDSDGINDKQEVDGGSDPNCPSGQDCSIDAGSGATSEADASVSSPLPAADTDATADSQLNDTDERQAIEAIFDGTVDAASLRVLLKNSGMSSEMLEQITDEQLLDMYKKTLESQQ